MSTNFARNQARAVGSLWVLLALIGLLSVAAGVIILFKPGDSLATLAVIAGVFLLLDGILEIGSSLAGDVGNRGLTALVGVLTLVVGIILVRHPIAGVAAIALLIGIWLVSIGVVRLMAAFEMAARRGWNAAVGIIDILAGTVIVASPGIGFATLALLAGIAFIANGIGLVSLGWKIRALGHEAATRSPHLGAPA